MGGELRIVVTNNPKVKEYFDSKKNLHGFNLIFEEEREDVFITTRNFIHKNWELLNHSMMGNIPVHKHPYRSLALKKNTTLDTKSLALIETAIEMLNREKMPNYPENILGDFQDMDLILFKEVKL